MAAIVSTLVPLLMTAAVLAVMMLLVMGVGWASGKILRRVLGIGGK